MLAKKRKLEQQENEVQTPGCKLHVVNLMYPRTSGRNPECRFLQKLRLCFDLISFQKRRGSIVYLSSSWSKSANYGFKHSSCRHGRVMALALSQRFYCELIDSFPKCKYRVCKAEEMKNSIFIYRYCKYWCRNIVLSVLPRKISSQVDSTNFLFQIRKVFILFYLRSGKRKAKIVQAKAQEKTALILHCLLSSQMFY